ncbi:MAG: HAMP domain-containing histidine kinase, partial [Anaerolineae bacterium]|nr:HAMP domain-containing histidine kinase [Anaerolineae bacterium]
MPELSGFEVLRELRMDPATVDIPFIFLTGRVERDDRRTGMNLGANDYLTKPFSENELLAAIQSRLGQRAREQAKHETTITKLRKNIVYALPHELRTPLTSIMGYSRLMRDSVATLSDDDIVEMSVNIYQAGERLNQLVENYLVYAQLELIAADEDDLRKLRNNVLRDAAEIISEVARQRAACYERTDDLVLELTSSAARMSEQNLAKIAEELIDNAFKFSQPGTPVLVKAARKDQCYNVFIRDRGRGMTSEQISTVGAYMQFDRALHEQQGVGLGFYVSKRIIELHGGDFEVRSQPGNGTGIFFSIPD